MIDQRSRARDATSVSGRITLIYVLVAGLWILLSDRLLDLVGFEGAALSRLQTVKGWAFVGVTGALLYHVVRRALVALESSRDALAQSEARFRSMFENAPVSLWEEDFTSLRAATEELASQGVTDVGAYLDSHPEFVRDVARKIRVLDVNQATLDLYGARSKEELIGSLDQVFTAESYPVFRGEVVAFAEGRRLFECEGSNRTLGGAAIDVLMRATVPPGDRGFENVLVSITDLTARKRVEEERRSLERQVQQGQKLESLGVLAGGVAHDFNNLLTAILGHAELALRCLPPDAPARRSLERVEAAAARAAELANQMLAYSGRGGFSEGPVHLNRVVEEMVDLLEASISKKAGLELRLAEGLPAVHGDPVQLRQVVMNLITNAAEALEPHEGTVTVTTGSMEVDRAYLEEAAVGRDCQPGRYLFLEVSDTGAGMDQETLSRIFDPFFTTKFTGRGLGLSVVLGIVRGHGGAVHVRTRPSGGTAFRVLLPCRDEPPVVEEAVAPASPPPPTARGAGRTILLVDDQEEVRRVGEEMLRTGGYRVVTAVDGAEGIRRFLEETATIDAVLLDLTMPRLGGEEALAELRRIRPDVPVVVVSGYSELECAGRIGARARVAFLQKPFRTAQLLETLDRLLGDTTGRG